MPQRPPSLVERLRSAWSHASEVRTASAPTAAAEQAVARVGDKGRDFADRLRAAVDTRP